MDASIEQKIRRLLERCVEEVIVRESLEKKLRSGKKLRIKFGADPSRPDLHLGHAVVLWKLKEFQDLGHKVIFVIGDFTALIGDPSGKSKTRPMLAAAEIKKNARTYFKQVGKILDAKKCEVRFNSEWLGKMKAADFIDLAAKFTVARILERDDFARRLKEHADVHVHELLYPMLQAQDSIVLEADVEIGATDQKFNMLSGRDLARRHNLPEQDVITCKILVGTDGVRKMSKSLDNYVALEDSPDEMFGKTMSIPDAALPNWLELAAEYADEEIDKEKAALKSGTNPRDVKARLARRIVALYHGEKAGEAAARTFDARFKEKQMPMEMKEWTIGGPLSVMDLVTGAFKISRNEVRRLLEQGGLKLEGETLRDSARMIDPGPMGKVLQKGKLHFVRVKRK